MGSYVERLPILLRVVGPPVFVDKCVTCGELATFGLFLMWISVWTI